MKVILLEYNAIWNDTKWIYTLGLRTFRKRVSLSEWSYLDRDIHEKKIPEEGLQIIAAKRSDNKGSVINKTSEIRHKALKSQACLSLANGQFSSVTSRLSSSA